MQETRNLDFLRNLSEEIRTSTFETILNANNGHLGASSSSAELMTALYFGNILRYNPSNPSDMHRDRVYVRGHVGPLRYKIFSLLGWIDEKELMTYRSLGSRLKGHESMHHMPGVDITPSGSLGMLLSYGAGAAYMTKKLGLKAKHFVFLGDGEEQEGNVAEAARHIASIGLDNIVCILDKNTKQLSRPTSDVDTATDVRKVWEGYGWKVLGIESGHNVREIVQIYDQIGNNSGPIFIVANTQKGKGLENHVNHFNGYHTLSACSSKDIVSDAIKERRGKFGHNTQDLSESLSKVEVRESLSGIRIKLSQPQTYRVDIEVNPNNNTNLDNSQSDYFTRLVTLSKTLRMPFFFMTPDLIHKEDVESIGLDQIDGYIDTGIREQHTIAMAHGMSQTNPNARIFINYFDAFLYRASDQLNAAAQGKSRIILLSEMSGLTQGKNGESHQSSGQPAVPLMMPGVRFYEPADVQDLYNVFNYCFSNNLGISVVRAHRADISPLERNVLDRENIDFYTVFEPDKTPDITLVGSGYVVGELVKAAKKLEIEYNINARAINVINLKQLNERFVNLLSEGRPVLTVYNGNPKILQSTIASVVMEHEVSRPSKIIGHGFEFGDTGSITDLTRHYRFDEAGIINIIMERIKPK